MQEVISDYGSPPLGLTVHDPYGMDLAGERIDFYFYKDNSGLTVDYDLPLNGEWSDLTAIFSFKSKDGGFAFYLDDIHVL